MNKILVEIIARFAVFLEFADESEIQLETSVQQQEELAFRLQKLSQPEREEFILVLHEIAENNPFPDQREYLLNLPHAIGID